MMLWYSYSSLVGVDINFIDYFVHKTVKAQLSPIYLIKRFKGFWGGGGGGGGGVGGWRYMGDEERILLSQY